MTPHCFKMSTVKALMARVKFHLLASPLPSLFHCCPSRVCSPGVFVRLLQQTLKLVFLHLFKACAPLSPKEKKRSKKEKKPLYLLQTVTGLCNNAAFLSLF